MDASTRNMIKWVISFLVPATLFLIPTNEVYTFEMNVFLVITLWAVLMFMFELLNTTIISIALTFGYCISGIASLSVALAPWTTPTIWMVFCSLVMVYVVQDTSLLKRIAYHLIIWTGGTYQGILYGIAALSIVACFLIPSLMTSFAIMALAYGICQALNIKKGKTSGGIMLVSALSFLEAGNFLYIPQTTGVAVGAINQITTLPMNSWLYLKHNIVFLPLVFLLTFMIGKLMKPEQPIDGKEYFEKELANLGAMTAVDKKILTILIALVVYLFTCQWHGFDMLYGFIGATILMFIPKIGIGEKKHIEMVDMGTIIFCASCMGIGNVGAAVGIGPALSSVLLPYLGGLNSIAFVGIIFIVGVLANILMTPLALITILAPPLAQIAMDMGITAYPIAYTLCMAGNNLLFPYENTIVLICFGFGLIYMKDFVKVLGAKLILCFIYLLVIGVPYWMLLNLA